MTAAGRVTALLCTCLAVASRASRGKAINMRAVKIGQNEKIQQL